VSKILIETGSALLLETGDAFLTEDSLSLDGTASRAGSSATNPVSTGTLTCTGAGRVIVVAITVNGTTVSGVSATGATFTLRKAMYDGLDSLEYWTGYASGTFSSAITVTYAASPGFNAVHAFGISGAPSSSYFDTNAGLPNNGTPTGDPRSVSTDTADTFIVGLFKMNSQANPTAGAGFTKIFGQDFQLTEYQIVAATQSALSVPITTGVGDAYYGIGDAIRIVSTAAATGPRRLAMMGAG
jgi:hypothetical protein